MQRLCPTLPPDHHRVVVRCKRTCAFGSNVSQPREVHRMALPYQMSLAGMKQPQPALHIAAGQLTGLTAVQDCGLQGQGAAFIHCSDLCGATRSAKYLGMWRWLRKQKVQKPAELSLVMLGGLLVHMLPEFRGLPFQ